MTKLRPTLILLLLVCSYVLFSNSEKIAKQIAHQFSPVYKPMSKQEILDLYSGYYWEGCSAAERMQLSNTCAWDEMQHKSSVMIVDLTELSRLAKFEEKYINRFAKNTALCIEILLSALWIVIAVQLIRHLRTKHDLSEATTSAFTKTSTALSRIFYKLLSALPVRRLVAQYRVKMAETEHQRIKRLFESGLISETEYQNRKNVLIARVNDNLG